MRFAVRVLATVAALAIAVASPSHAFKLHTGDIYQVPEADRVSAKQVYAREAAIVAAGSPFLKLHLTVPGRVYIRHVANETAVAAGLFGKVRASGDTREAVDYVAFPTAGEFPDQDASDALSLAASSAISQSAVKSDSLLLDVELYTKNTLRSVSTAGTADVVVADDVLSPSTNATNPYDDTTIEYHPIFDNIVPGKVFVSDPKAHFHSSTFAVYTKGFGNVQIDVASLTTTDSDVWFSVSAASNVTLFASEFVSPVGMEVNLYDSEPLARNPLCIATKDDVALEFRGSTDRKNVTRAVISGDSTCAKLPLPAREPSLIGEDIATLNDIPDEASAPTFPPVAAASTATNTPAPASSATSLVSIGSLPTLMSLVLGLWSCL